MSSGNTLNESEALKDVENSLRDFISAVLWEKYKENWIQKSGVTPERILQWETKKNEEVKKLKSGITEERLIYYSDFYDLETIILKNWDSDFKAVFHDMSTFKVYFKILADFRNPDAHRRELLTYQKHLIIGISSDIRNKIVTYRSKMETDDDIFPRLESIRDNFGNVWIPNKYTLDVVFTKTVLHPGDLLEYIIKATDPLGGKLFYQLLGFGDWQEENVLSVKIGIEHIRKDARISILLKSARDYHAQSFFDQSANFNYRIIPKKGV